MPSAHKFRHLVRFNRVDWSDARVALLKEVDVLRQKEISVTGKWALINVLQATGNTEDAKQARILVEELTRDQTHFSGWRLVEEFCAADPCDPTSEKPDNVKQTAQNYRDIDVKKLRLSVDIASEDDFFAMARSGTARFEAQVAIAKQGICSRCCAPTGLATVHTLSLSFALNQEEERWPQEFARSDLAHPCVMVAFIAPILGPDKPPGTVGRPNPTA